MDALADVAAAAAPVASNAAPSNFPTTNNIIPSTDLNTLPKPSTSSSIEENNLSLSQSQNSQQQPQKFDSVLKDSSIPPTMPPGRRRGSCNRKRSAEDFTSGAEPSSKRDRKQSPRTTDSDSDKDKEKDGKDRQRGLPWLDTLRLSFQILEKQFPNVSSFSVADITKVIEENYQQVRNVDNKTSYWKLHVPRSCKRYLHKDYSKRGEHYFSPNPAPNPQNNMKDNEKLNSSSDQLQANKSNSNAGTVVRSEDVIPGKRGFTEVLARVPPEWIDEAFRPVRLSEFDKAKKISFVGNPLENVIQGFKGYRTIRATSGVMDGDWYFETQVLPHEGMGNVRVGWAMRRTDEETPVGYDGYSFSLRDKSGELFHMARGYKYAEPFKVGDVIGCRITLPALSDEQKSQVEKAEKRHLEKRFVRFMQGTADDSGIDILDKACVRFYKNGKDYGIPTIFKEYQESLEKQTKENVKENGSLEKSVRGNDDSNASNQVKQNNENKQFKQELKSKQGNNKVDEAGSKGSSSGQVEDGKDSCIPNLSETTRMMKAGMYYPAIALYFNGTVKVNFGPDFKFPLPDGSRPMCEAARERPVEEPQSKDDDKPQEDKINNPIDKESNPPQGKQYTNEKVSIERTDVVQDQPKIEVDEERANASVL